MMTIFPVVLLALAMATNPVFVAIGGKHGVEVFQRQDSAVIEMYADGEIEAPPSAVQAVLLDYASAPLITHRLAVSQVLEQGPGALLVYQRLNLPVVAARDYTLRVTWGAVGQTRQTRFVTANQQGPAAQNGVVRMPLLVGGWDLTPLRDGQATRARYHFRIDFGGSVPRWLVRPGAAKDLPLLFEGVRHLVASRQGPAVRGQAMASSPRWTQQAGH